MRRFQFNRLILLSMLCLAVLLLTIVTATASSVSALTGPLPAKTAAASITLSPTSGPPTTSITIKGHGFSSEERIVITFGSTRLVSIKGDQHGRFTTSIKVPASAASGLYLVQATSRHNGRVTIATAKFQVQTNWTMFGYDRKHTHTNPYENVLSQANVSNLAAKWIAPILLGTISSPAVVNGVVYIGSDDGSLYAFNAQTGTQLWRVTTGSNINSSPAVVNGVVYVGSHDSNVYAFNARTGIQIWKAPTGADIAMSSPVVINSVVYIGSEDQNLYALNAQTGAQLWKAPTGGWIISSPTVANGVVYVGSQDNSLYAFNARTGIQLWSYQTGNWIWSSPAVANGLVYVGSTDGNMYAYALPHQTVQYLI
ncbi:MAG: beta-alanine-activating enzyme beta-propeller domain-containing protein [Ktedonobacteraceae bacterium]